MISIHQFQSTADAYAAVNTGIHMDTNEDVNNGDVLVCASEGVIGVACHAWPVAVAFPDGDPGSFHTVKKGSKWDDLDGEDYSESHKIAVETAHADADITGNHHWNEV